jgi:hypothetical protein
MTTRSVLSDYARTVLVPVLGLVALPVAWTLTASAGWPAAVAGVAAASASSAASLYRRGWPPPLVHLVTWAAPAVVLAPLTALGELSPAGLVLWAPLTTMLAVCLAMTGRMATAG